MKVAYSFVETFFRFRHALLALRSLDASSRDELEGEKGKWWLVLKSCTLLTEIKVTSIMEWGGRRMCGNLMVALNFWSVDVERCRFDSGDRFY